MLSKAIILFTSLLGAAIAVPLADSGLDSTVSPTDAFVILKDGAYKLGMIIPTNRTVARANTTTCFNLDNKVRQACNTFGVDHIAVVNDVKCAFVGEGGFQGVQKGSDGGFLTVSPTQVLKGMMCALDDASTDALAAYTGW